MDLIWIITQVSVDLRLGSDWICHMLQQCALESLDNNKVYEFYSQ